MAGMANKIEGSNFVGTIETESVQLFTMLDFSIVANTVFLSASRTVKDGT